HRRGRRSLEGHQRPVDSAWGRIDWPAVRWAAYQRLLARPQNILRNSGIYGAIESARSGKDRRRGIAETPRELRTITAQSGGSGNRGRPCPHHRRRHYGKSESDSSRRMYGAGSAELLADP